MWSDSSRILSPCIQQGRLFLEKPDGFEMIGDTLKEVCTSLERFCEGENESIKVLDLSDLDLTDAHLSAILESLIEVSVSVEDEVRLSNNRLSMNVIAHLLEYIQSVMEPRQKLKEVDISQNRVSNPGEILEKYMSAHPEG
ncbi:hypothetical protein Pmar_PMAR012002 [Perkinsus marinus ATCC 50983]|uniref:Uncharacterized protein n=1 Tax=Perkinsus marinus (strain ATCC 50983 / TXsc) TaxID=423536 RepID=C5LW57_PERM5|nr:hypothetical protein Pmar_PMAR012002 [Perkinsus marinus ATCC 50983]EEQ98994.1 hypothetical protein Pmar_PMAR012002 [Perkinsus marinus ATCC 50983]|eukprot:XP_002766277.1 hypothetical protein Pmar_PMAR012002 [Perkinsus marinus ATCC 50983]